MKVLLHQLALMIAVVREVAASDDREEGWGEGGVGWVVGRERRQQKMKVDGMPVSLETDDSLPAQLAAK